MTGFEPIRFDLGQCARELDAFAVLLQAHERLSERQHVLPFFRVHRQLTAFLGSYFSPSIVVPDRVAYELDLFGAFTADVVVGDWEKKAFCLVEFEDGTADSVFVRRGRATTEWAPRFEHGMGQIIDWYWKLADLGGTASLCAPGRRPRRRRGGRRPGTVGVAPPAPGRRLAPHPLLYLR